LDVLPEEAPYRHLIGQLGPPICSLAIRSYRLRRIDHKCAGFENPRTTLNCFCDQINQRGHFDAALNDEHSSEPPSGGGEIPLHAQANLKFV
jgi:hypothetical protein